MKTKKTITIFLLLGLLLGFAVSYVLAQAGTIDFGKPGVSMWVFLAVAVFILLVQIGPALILLTSFRSLTRRPVDWEPINTKFTCWFIGFIVGAILSSPFVWARSIDISKAGSIFWIFIAVGAIIILLQLIPAIILFISFIGYTTKIINEKIPVNNEAPVPEFSAEKTAEKEKEN